MGRLELKLLGPAQAFIDGQGSTFRTRKALALLAYLAAEGGMHRREKLAELLWPASPDGRARTTLRSTLSRVRCELREVVPGSGGELLRVEGDLLGVEAGPGLVVDLDVLRGASAAARTSRLGGEKDDNLISTLRKADAAYRGEFLEGFRLEDAPEFDLWVEAQRGVWRGKIGEVLSRLAESESETGELAAAAGTAQRWVARDPTEEAAHVGLMEARSAAGDPGGALDAYEKYRSDLHDVGLDPQPGTETLHASIQTRARVDRTGEGRSLPGSLRMPFVGREAEFGALVGEYRAARSGAARSVVVLGEAGIGKTRLAEEFLGWAATRGADVLRAKASQTGGRQPYETLVDALRPRLERERAPDDLLEDRWLAELSRIMPELGDRYPDLPPPTSDEASSQAVLFEAVARVGAALAGGSSRRDGAGRSGEPLVVFGDDLQWADGASLDAMGYACRSWAREGVPVLLVMSARAEGLRRSRIGGWLSHLERELPARRVELARIDERAVYGLLRLLAGETKPGGDGELHEGLERVGSWLWGESGGHPLFLAHILGVLLERGVLAERVGRDGRGEIVLAGGAFDEGELRGLIPAGLRESILDKLRPLSADARDVWAAGAVLGRGFGFGELARVAGVGEKEGIAALDALVSARLLEEGGTPPWGAYSFAHDKIREVVYTEAGEARRGVFHRRALEVLEERGAPAAELARHALAAKLWEKALRHLLAAAEEAMSLFAAGDAVGYYERAQDLIADPSRETRAGRVGVPERLRLHGGLARARALIHDLPGAQSAYEKLLALAREAGDKKVEWEALYGLALLGAGFAVGPDDERMRSVRRQETLAGRAAERKAGRASSGAAHSPRVAREYAEQALRLANGLNRGDLIRRGEFALGVACTWAGMWEKASAHLEEALPPGSAADQNTPDTGTLDTEDLIHLAWSRSVTALSRGLIEGSPDAFSPAGPVRDACRETAEFWDRFGTEYARTQVGHQAVVFVLLGDFGDALSMAVAGLAASRSCGNPQTASSSLQAMGDAYCEMFAFEEARSAYRSMLTWVDSTFSALTGQVHAKLCSVAALAGEWDRAHEHALQARLLERDVFLPLAHLKRHLEIEALLRGGNAELARENLRLFERRTRGQKGYFRLAYLRSEAVLARWNGDTDGTLSLLRGALGMAERLGLPGEAWQVGAALGEVHEERGETGASERAFGGAAVVVRRLSSKVPDGKFREGFLAAPQVRRVLEKSRDQGTHPGPPVL